MSGGRVRTTNPAPSPTRGAGTLSSAAAVVNFCQIFASISIIDDGALELEKYILHGVGNATMGEDSDLEGAGIGMRAQEGPS